MHKQIHAIKMSNFISNYAYLSCKLLCDEIARKNYTKKVYY